MGNVKSCIAISAAIFTENLSSVPGEEKRRRLWEKCRKALRDGWFGDLRRALRGCGRAGWGKRAALYILRW
jgi:hypothetical protein